jgi:hypothetical protein
MNTCPHCGYCPHCGRSAHPYQFAPYFQPYLYINALGYQQAQTLGYQTFNSQTLAAYGQSLQDSPGLVNSQ